MEYQNKFPSQIDGDYLSGNSEDILNSGYDKAAACLKNHQFGDAITLLENSLLQAIKKYGEGVPELAKPYFNLGSAILIQIENSREIFVSSAASREQQCSTIHEDTPEMQSIHSKHLGLTVSEIPQAYPYRKEQVSAGIYKQLEETNPDSQPLDKISECVYQKEVINNDEELVDIQLAWEHLELARLYTETKLNFLRDEGKIEEISKTMNFLSVIHSKLGDVNYYQENFKEALTDYEQCLSLRQFYEDHFYSRGIAEAFYLIGQANLGINTKEADLLAILNFHKARIIIENILSRTYGCGAKKDPENKQEHISIFRKEFLQPSIFEIPETTELKSILCDLYNKIEDTIQQANERGLVEQKTQEYCNNFEKPASIKESLQERLNSHQVSAPLSIFSGIDGDITPFDSTKTGQHNNKIHSEGPPNATKLGVFGNGAKKRIKLELPIIPERSEDSLDIQKQTSNGLDKFENITKVDRFGKPEKMIKTN